MRRLKVVSLHSELEAVDQPQTSAPAQVADHKAYTQVDTHQPGGLSRAQEPQVSPQDKGELEEERERKTTFRQVFL